MKSESGVARLERLVQRQGRDIRRLADAVERLVEATTSPSSPKKRGESASEPWDGDWSKLPGTLTAAHMAAILGVTVNTIWDRVQQRRIEVNPIRWVPPYRWIRDRVRNELQGRQ